ncbi:hypothetical protein D3C72_2146000 [compost metagenome]
MVIGWFTGKALAVFGVAAWVSAARRLAKSSTRVSLLADLRSFRPSSIKPLKALSSPGLVSLLSPLTPNRVAMPAAKFCSGVSSASAWACACVGAALGCAWLEADT